MYATLLWLKQKIWRLVRAVSVLGWSTTTADEVQRFSSASHFENWRKRFKFDLFGIRRYGNVSQEYNSDAIQVHLKTIHKNISTLHAVITLLDFNRYLSRDCTIFFMVIKAGEFVYVWMECQMERLVNCIDFSFYYELFVTKHFFAFAQVTEQLKSNNNNINYPVVTRYSWLYKTWI